MTTQPHNPINRSDPSTAEDVGTVARPALLLWTALVATVTAPVVLNAVNLYRLSTQRLGLDGLAALALPVTLDGAALVALVVRLRALRDGDSAPAASLAVITFAGLSAWLAGTEGWAVGGLVGALALGVLPLVAVTMLDLAIASIRRTDLRAAGMLPGRAPIFSTLRWVLAPRSTFTAWRHGILWENPDRLACLTATARVTMTAVPISRETRGATLPTSSDPTSPAGAAITPAGRVPAEVDQGAKAALVSAWAGTKRELIRSLIAAGHRDRADIITEATRQGLDVSAREVTRLLHQTRAVGGSTVASDVADASGSEERKAAPLRLASAPSPRRHTTS